MAGTSVDAPPPNKVFVEKYLYFIFMIFSKPSGTSVWRIPYLFFKIVPLSQIDLWQ